MQILPWYHAAVLIWFLQWKHRKCEWFRGPEFVCCKMGGKREANQCTFSPFKNHKGLNLKQKRTSTQWPNNISFIANSSQWLANNCPISPSIMEVNAQLIQPNPFSVWACRKIKMIWTVSFPVWHPRQEDLTCTHYHSTFLLDQEPGGANLTPVKQSTFSPRMLCFTQRTHPTHSCRNPWSHITPGAM